MISSRILFLSKQSSTIFKNGTSLLNNIKFSTTTITPSKSFLLNKIQSQPTNLLLKNRFYSTNNNSNSNNNKEEPFNKEEEPKSSKNETKFEFLNRNKRKILYSFGIGLGVLTMLGDNGTGTGGSINDVDITRNQKVYYKYGAFEIREKHLVIGGLVGANLLVFALLKNGAFFNRYAYHFFCSAASLHKYPSSIILSTFTHTEPFHFLFNMYALSTFGSVAYDHLGAHDFLILYFLGGLVGSMTSLTFKLLTAAVEIPSIGASGCVFSVLAASVFFDKESKLGIMFLPISFDGLSFLHCIMLFDLLGCLVRPLARMTGWDHACHLGSAITGYFIGGLYPYKEKFQHFNGSGRIVAPNFIYQGSVKNGDLEGYGELKNDKYIQKGSFKGGNIQAGEITFRNTGEKRYYQRKPTSNQ